MTSAEETHRMHTNPEIAPVRRRMPRWVRTFLRNPASLAGIFLVLLFIAVALGAAILAPPTNPAEPYQIPRSCRRPNRDP